MATLAKNRNKIERMTQKAFQLKRYPADRQLFETWKSSQRVLFTCFEKSQWDMNMEAYTLIRISQ